MKVRIISLVIAALFILPLIPTTAGAMEIFVRVTVADGDGRTITLAVEPSDTIEAVKAKIRDAEGYAPDSQRLYLGSALLDNVHSLAYYEIGEESTLYLVVLPADSFTVIMLPGEGEGEPITYTYPFDEYGDLPTWAGNLQFYKDKNNLASFKLNADYCPDSFIPQKNYLFDGWEGLKSLLHIVKGKPATVTAKWKLDRLNAYGPIEEIPAADGGNIYLGGIRWRVIGEKDQTRLLVSSDTLGDRLTWSEAEAYRDRIYDGFSALEKAAVIPTTKTDGEYTVEYSDLPGHYNPKTFQASELNGAKLFSLSAAETEYYLPTFEDRATGDWWWLRSRSADIPSNMGLIFDRGEFVSNYVDYLIDPDKGVAQGVRPAFQFDSSRVLFEYRAGSPKPGPGDGFYTYFAPNERFDAVLTLRDPDRSDFGVFREGSVCAGGKLTLQYWGAKNGPNEYISALICDTDEKPMYYASERSLGNGFASFDLPADLPGDEIILKVFNEQRNGQYETDYASEPKTFHISVVPGFRASFYNYDGSLLESGLFPEGTTPVYSGPTPVKPGDDPRLGYRFVGWDPEPGPITGSADYTAKFNREPVKTVTFAANGGSGTMENDSYFESEGKYRLPECGFTPPAGRVFVSWCAEYNNDDGSATVKYLSPGSLLTGLTSDVALRAEWKQLSLNVRPAGAGAAEFDPETGAFTATANPGYTFDRWEYSNGGADVVPEGMDWPEDNPFRPGSVDFRYYTAVFSRDPQELTVKANVAARGTVSYSVPGDAVETGRRITLTAAPSDGYVFKEWRTYPEGIHIDSQNRFYMPARDVTVTAVFEPENEPEFKTASLLLTGQIGVNFYADLSGLAETERENVAVVFSVNGKTFTDTLDATHTDPDGNGYYGFTCFVNSIEMADEINATLCYPDGDPVTFTYSVKDYVDYVLENTDDFPGNAVALVRAIADYGHYSQLYFEPVRDWTLGVDHVAMPAENKLDADDVAAAREETADAAAGFVPGDSEIVKAGFSLVLDSETALRIYLTPADGFDGDVGAVCDGKVLGCTRQESGRYLIEIPGITAFDLGDTFTVTVTAAEKDAVISLSPLAYVRAVLNKESGDAAQYLATALYRYYAAAKAYFENPNG
ncbi:MAG: InlB B-repeat-containing protein [Clostridia bacterium]|nr:InlB B-repeat-containing protein [Clostridia bacterium]